MTGARLAGVFRGPFVFCARGVVAFAPMAVSILDYLLRFARWTQNKVPVTTYNTVEIDPATLLLTDDPANKRQILSVVGGAAAVVTWAAVKAALAAAASVVDINGQPLRQGPLYQAAGRATTVGGATSAFTQALAAPLVTGSHAAVDLHVTCNDGTYFYAFDSAVGFGYDTIGSPGATGPSSTQANTMPMSPHVASSWSGGVLTVGAAGPSATITAASDNGSGKVRLAISAGGGAGLTAALTGLSVTISGLAVCTEANGAHVATYVSAGAFDLAAVVLVHAGADSGVAVLTAPQTLLWGGTLRVTAP